MSASSQARDLPGKPTSSERSGKRQIILFLSALSGSCGLAYEILYVRLFSNYFGDGFLFSGITLTAVFLGISFGAWQSQRFAKRLGLIELLIGIYAFGSALVFSRYGFDVVALGGGHVLMRAALLFVLLITPAFLLGTCVPLFARYARQSDISASRTFTTVYGLYNFGAFLSILLIEFFLFRTFGLSKTLMGLGVVNIMIGGWLLTIQRAPEHPRKTETNAPLEMSPALTLFLVSVASGIFQLFSLKLSYAIFGPLHENFAILLASAIFGVALGSALAACTKITLQTGVCAALVALGLILLTTGPFIALWSGIAGTELSDGVLRFAKSALLLFWTLPLFTSFGMMVPLALKAHNTATTNTSARLLGLSALGNGLGTLLMFLVLYKAFDLPVIGMIVVVLLAGALTYLLISKAKGFVLASVFVWVGVGVLAWSATALWPEREVSMGYRALVNPKALKTYRENYQKITSYRAYDQNASLVHFKDAQTWLVLNGYRSLTFGSKRRTTLHETIVGALPAVFSKETKSALVFGLGSGISASGTARFYGKTKVVEINPAILNIPNHFTQENNGVENNPDVEIKLEDGISTLLHETKIYDAIINTVTSPKYYSASKLYTKDFYDIVKTRLSDGGVYASWFDLSIDRDGIAIMLNTLEASFAKCRYFFLSRGYFAVACSNDPLLYQPTVVMAEREEASGMGALLGDFQLAGGFAGVMSSLETEFGAAFLDRANTSLNTLDRPLIEFIVTGLHDSFKTGDFLAGIVEKNIAFRKKTAFAVPGAELACRNQQIMVGYKLKGC